MMTRLCTRQDMRDGWIIVQDGVYRFRVEQYGGYSLDLYFLNTLPPKSIGVTIGEGKVSYLFVSNEPLAIGCKYQDRLF